MSIRASWVLPLLLCSLPIQGAEPVTGFQDERRVRQATRLDWEFVAGKPAKLPSAYDPRKVKYQLFVPPSYKSDRAWPLIVFVAPGDAPLGWRAFEKTCTKHELLFCVAHGAGNGCNAVQRFRTLCEMLDDIRRDYRIDPDRSFTAGHGASSAVAFRLATALPESFGGTLLLSGDSPLPSLDHLRFRLQDRLSVALVCGNKEPLLEQMRGYRLTQLTELGVSAKYWEADCAEGELPPGESLIAPIAWLLGDLKRRRDDTKEHGGDELAATAYRRAERDSRLPDRGLRAAAELEWLTLRFGESETGRAASRRLQAMREETETLRRLDESKRMEGRRRLLAEAKALAKGERWSEARAAWRKLAETLTDPEARDEAKEQVSQMDRQLARKPYLGLTFEGATATVKAVVSDGPAHRAGLRAGDRIDKRDGQPVTTAADLSKPLVTGKPGQVWTLEVIRGGESVKVRLTIGSQPPR